MTKNILFFTFWGFIHIMVFSQETTEKDYVISGNQYYHSGAFANAEAQYKSALSKNNQSIKANYNLGNTLYQQKRYDEAKLHYEKVAHSASASKPDKHRAFHNIGKIFLDQENPEKALENFKKALKLDPYDEETRYNYVLAKKMLENKRKNDQQNHKDNQEQGDDPGEQDPNEQQDPNKKGNNPDENKGSRQNGGETGNKGKGNSEEKNQNQISKGSDGKNRQPSNSLSKEYQEGILQALENQEQETLKRIISQKAKKVRSNTEKDW